MTYCPICGQFDCNNKTVCSDPLCIEKALNWKGYEQVWRNKEGVQMLVATTENRYCGRCNSVFAKNVDYCMPCARPTKQLDASHLTGFVILLSAMEAKKVWEH